MKKQRSIDSKEYLYATQKIENWYKSNNKALSIVSSPFNSIKIFKPIINEVIKKQGRILYICSEREQLKNIISGTIIDSLKLKYSSVEDSGSKFICLNFEEAIAIKDNYELIILDEISNLGTSEKIHIKLLMEYLYDKAEKIICYSVDSIINVGQHIEICDVSDSRPIVEPRFISTKINLEKDMPFSLYEYFEWFNLKKSNVVILVSDVNRYRETIHKYMDAFKLENIQLIYLKKDSKKANKLGINNDKTTFIITNEIASYIRNIKNVNIVVIDSDNIIYNYKTLVYLSTIVARNSKEQGEILLVSNSISNNMEIAKNIVREYNKNLWEKGLLKY